MNKLMLLAMCLPLLVACPLDSDSSSKKGGAAPNIAPIADAGSSQFVTSGDVVSLDASDSSDAEDNIESYSWLQTDGTGLTLNLSHSQIAQPTFTAPALTAAKTFIFEVTVTDTGGLLHTATVNIAIQPVMNQTVNATGVILCGDYAFDGGSGNHNNDQDCADTTDSDGDSIPDGQDAHHGRAASDVDNTDGSNGFSFTKLDANGDPLPQSATEWSCVLDNVTQLIWEVKQYCNDLNCDLLRQASDQYVWHDSNASTNGGKAGPEEGANCRGGISSGLIAWEECTTEKFINVVNEQGLCGANDWVLPTRRQLRSIYRYDIPDGNALSLDEEYFPNINTQSRRLPYWTSSSDVTPETDYESGYAWVVHFGPFGTRGEQTRTKDNTYPVRLVRASQ